MFVFVNELNELLQNGVYKIYNPLCIEHGIYVGSASFHRNNTVRTGFKKRAGEHISALTNNKHTNRYLQNLFNKYPTGWTFEIIEICDVQDCVKKEQYWINHFDSYHNGINLIEKAGSTLGLKHSEESIRKRCTPIYVIDILDGIVTNFECQKYFAQQSGISNFLICRAIKKKNLCFNRYYIGYDSEQVMSLYQEHFKFKVESHNEIIFFRSLNEIRKRYGLSSSICLQRNLPLFSKRLNITISSLKAIKGE